MTDALSASPGSKGLSTSEVMALVRKTSGTQIPEQSFRQALRTLARGKTVQTRRVGREKTYRLIARSEEKPISPAVPPERRAPPSSSVPLEIDTTHLPPHKLAVGEVLVLSVGETHVETATNVHGKVVLERHPRPKQTQ